MTLNNILSSIDFIGLINLISRPDRLSSILRLFDSLHINPLLFHFIHPTKHPAGGIFGCYNSHLTLYHNAISSGANFALILEDDFEFIDSTSISISHKFNICLDFIHNNFNNWDILKITNDLLFSINSNISPNIYASFQASGQGYFINKHCMVKMLQDGIIFYKNTVFHIDMAHILLYKFKIYTCIPEIIQNNSLALFNDNDMHIPDILSSYPLLHLFAPIVRYPLSFQPSHFLCSSLSNLNLPNVTDVFIYINIFITLLVSSSLHFLFRIPLSLINILITLITSIIVIFLFIFIEYHFTLLVYDSWISLLHDFYLKKIPSHPFHTRHNVSSLLLYA
jgi:GR25 family glycosyltransferase involved in LPS biosynthesis